MKERRVAFVYQIITDTSANLDTKVLRERRIRVVPFSFFVHGKGMSYADTVLFDGKAFFEEMRKGTQVTTSQVTPQQYINHFTPVLKQGQDILFIGMSSGISGSFACAQMAKKELLESFPDRSICLVDTLSASLGEGLLVLKAADYRDQGVSLEENAARIQALCPKMCQIFTVDDLVYLKRSGRLSSVSAVLGSVLNIKPILKGNALGQIVSFAKLRGRKAAIEFLAKQYDAMVRNAREEIVGISHADCLEDAKLLQRLLRRNNPPKEIMTVCYEPVTGSHVGPGTLALFFLGDESFRTAKA